MAVIPLTEIEAAEIKLVILRDWAVIGPETYRRAALIKLVTSRAFAVRPADTNALPAVSAPAELILCAFTNPLKEPPPEAAVIPADV